MLIELTVARNDVNIHINTDELFEGLRRYSDEKQLELRHWDILWRCTFSASLAFTEPQYVFVPF